MDMDSTVAGTPVISDLKRLVSGPCWNLNLRCQLFESLSLCCCLDVPCKQQLDSVFWSVEKITVFQAYAVVNVKTGGMF